MAAGFPNSYVVEVELTAGVWTDITTSVVGDSIEITVGKDSPAGDIQPGTLDLILDNFDGTWTPDNPLSTYYPNVVEGKRIRVVVNKGTPGGYSTGAYGTGPYSGTLASSARFVGRVTTWEPDFPDVPNQSKTRVQAVDALGDLARHVMAPTLLGSQRALYELSGETPPTQSFWYWPLSGGYRLLDLVTGVESLSYYQPTTGGEVAWESDSSFPYSSDACLALTNGVGLQVNLRKHVSGLLNAHRIGGVFRLGLGTSGVLIGATDVKPTAATVSGAVVWWDGVGTLSVRQYTSGSSSTIASVPVSIGWHTVSLFFGSGSEDITVDGVTTAATGLAALPTMVSVGGTLDIAVRDLYINSGTLFDAYLTSTGQSLATVTQNVSKQSGIDGLDASLGWSSSVSSVIAVPPATDGRSALDVVADLANSQAGIAYVAYSQSDPQPVILVANADSRDTTVDLTLDAEDDLVGGPTLDRNVYDKVSSATAKTSLDAVTVTDSTLTGTYGASTAERQSVLSDANMLAASASDLIAQTKSSKLRLSKVTFDLVTASNDLYSNWFGLALGERVRVSNLPSTYFGVTQMDGYVLGWTERPTVYGYEVTLNLQPADAPAEAKYDDATYGRYGWADGAATGTGGTAMGTTSTGTLIITTASGPTLTTSAGMYPMQLDWNGECVTVSAPGGAGSPQTVTITARGVNGTVARVHASGERVDVWNTARYAL